MTTEQNNPQSIPESTPNPQPPSTSISTPEPNSEPIPMPNPFAQQSPKKNKKIILTLACILLVLCLGVGAYFLYFNTPAEPISDNKVEEQKSSAPSSSNVTKTTEPVSDANPDTQSNSETQTESDVPGGAHSVIGEATYDGEYVYIERWGIKIKFSNDLKILGSLEITSENDKEKIYVRMVDIETANALTNIPTDSVGMIPGIHIVRTIDQEYDPFSFGSPIQPVYNDGEYNYFAYQPTGYQLDSNLAEYSSKISNAFAKAFEEVFSDPANYSAI